MTHSVSPPKDQDDRLADFTDRVLEQKTAALAAAADSELRGQEDAVLRLNRAFSAGALDEKTRQRLYTDFKARLRREAPASRPAVWQSQQTRQRLGLAVAAIALIAAAFVITSFFASSNGGLTASAGVHGQNIALFVVLIGVLLLALWLARRK